MVIVNLFLFPTLKVDPSGCKISMDIFSNSYLNLGKIYIMSNSANKVKIKCSLQVDFN